MKRINSESGLTLIEIMVVLIIIGVMVSTFGKKLFGAGDKMKAQLAQTQLQTLKSYIEQYNLRYNNIPNTIRDLSSCTEATGQGCIPIANEEELLDPWGVEFQYSRNGNRYQIKTMGADSTAGGDGVNFDTFIEGP